MSSNTIWSWLLLISFVSAEWSSTYVRLYVFHDIELRRDDAEQYCALNYQPWNGHLAAVETPEENEEVASVCPDTLKKQDGCMIGLMPDSISDFWTDGTPFAFANWAPDGRPDLSFPTVVIRPGDANGAANWRQRPDIGFRFVCQKEKYISLTFNNMQFEIYGDRLHPDEPLYTGQALVSNNRRFVAALQTDGNFVVYDLLHNRALWAPNQNMGGSQQRYVVLQGSDGNLVVYNVGGGAVWATADLNCCPMVLVMQDDGNMVVYNINSEPYWDIYGHSGSLMAFVDSLNEASTQQYFQPLATLFAVITFVVLVCVWGIKRRSSKKVEAMMDAVDHETYATF